MGAVLMQGLLEPGNFSQAKKEIVGYSRRNQPFTLVVDSKGGDIESTFDFVDFLNDDQKIKLLEGVKIIYAGSAATFLALSLPVKRTMFWKSKLGLHLGCVNRLEFIELDPEGRIPKAHFERFNTYFDKLTKLLINQKVLTKQEISEILIPKGSMELSSVECLRKGIVQSLF